MSLCKHYLKIGLFKFDYQDTMERIGIIFSEEDGFSKSTDDKSKDP